MKNAKIILVLVLLLCCHNSISNSDIKSLLWSADIKNIINSQNSSSERAKYSNEFVNLDSVQFDSIKSRIIYIFSLKIDASEDDILKFHNQNVSDFNEIDCGQKNFAHPKIGNSYILKDIRGNIVGQIDTSYEDCKLKDSILYRK